MERNNFGIDRITLKGFELASIEWDKVDKLYEKVKVNSIGKYLYFKSFGKNSDRDFSSLQISDYKNLKKLSIGVKVIKKILIPYVYMEIINSDDCFRNLYLNSIDDINYKMDTIINDLEKHFGIKLVKNEVKIHEIEIARNIYLDVNFKEYSPILKTFSFLYSSWYKRHNFEGGKTNEYESFILENSYCKFKMYNKAEQMKVLYNIDGLGNILRMEYLLKEDKLQNSFKNSELNSFTDNNIKDWFLRQMNKNIKNRFDNHIKTKKREYKLLYKEILSLRFWKTRIEEKIFNDAYSWIKDNKTVVYTVDIVNEIVKKKDSKNFTRSIEALRKNRGYRLMESVTERYLELSEKIYSMIEE